MWCRRPLRSACSPCSAGNVCWAKPNHAFFKCQQSFAKFFHAAPATRAAHAADAPAMHACKATARCMPTTEQSPARKHWRGLQRYDQGKHAARTGSVGRRAPRLHDVRCQRTHAASPTPDFASHKRVCAKSARTFSHRWTAAMPRIGCRRRPRHSVRGTRRRQEKTRGVSAAGLRKRRSRGAQWSSLSSSSAYSSGPSSSLSCSASATSTTNSQPSP